MVAEHFNPAVPITVLDEIWNWKQHGISIENAIQRMRVRTVPPGYTFQNWKDMVHKYNVYMYISIIYKHTGIIEGLTDMIRSGFCPQWSQWSGLTITWH